MQIFVTKNEERIGPIPLEEINRQLAAGLLNPADEAWYEGSPGWRALLSIPGVIMPGGASSTAEPITIATPARRRSMASFGGFWIRALAYVIDSLIIVIISEIVVQFLSYSAENSDLSLVAITLPFLISFVYMTILWSAAQATIGQKLCGLKVVDAITETKISFLRATGRWFALLLAMSILFVGVIMVAFNHRKQGLHDLFAGTCVVKSG